MFPLISLLLMTLSVVSTLAQGGPRAELVFAGDAMQHQRQLDTARRADGTYDYSAYYEAIEPYIASADYAVVNLETPLGGAPYSGYPMFCAPDSYLTSLKDAGFDLILTANNHCLDRRDRGLRRTIETIQKAELPWVGTYCDAAQRDTIVPRMVDVNGFRLGLLNYTYGTNGIAVQGNVVVDYINRDRIRRDVERARAKGAEIVVVAIHWGEEYRLLPVQSQRTMADYLTSLGVDLIIGGHPHVIEPMEIRRNPATGRDRFLCYSLGNFVSAMRTADTRGGALARIVLARDSAGQAIVESATYLPVVVAPPDSQSRDYRVLPARDPNLPASTREIRDAFMRGATRTFNRYNVRVPEDTLGMHQSRVRQLRRIFPQPGF